MMEEWMMRVLTVSGQAAVIFAVLLAVRGAFTLGRVPKKYSYALWAILFIRLLLPVQLESGWGLMPGEGRLVRVAESMLDMGMSRGARSGRPGDVSGYLSGEEGSAWRQESGGGEEQPWNMPSYQAAGESPAQNQAPHTENGQNTPENIGVFASGGGAGWRIEVWLIGIWAAGVALLWGYGATSYLLLKRRLCLCLRLEDCGGPGSWPRSLGGREERVYLADDISTPFVLGFIRPRIYLPSNMGAECYPYVAVHERTHIRRGDHLMKLGAYLLTCLYWFHPLVWAGYALMCRDMEMSCDEAVLGELGRDCRGEYADSLLRLTCGSYYPAGVPLAFGEGDTQGRIRHIMRYKKPVLLTAAGAVVLIAVLAVALLTSPREGDGLPQGSSPAGEKEEIDAQGSAAQQLTGDGNAVDFQVAYEEIECPKPIQTGYTSLGADGAILDYADEKTVIFHGYFGLYVYSVAERELVGAVDLQALGCGATQGDNTCQVLVNKGGSKVYFYPLSGMDIAERYVGDTEAESDGEEKGQTLACYVYEVSSGKLRVMTNSLWQPAQFYSRDGISTLTGEELSGSQDTSREVSWDVCREASWEEIGMEPAAGWSFYSDSCMSFQGEDDRNYGYLASVSGMLEDLVYVWGPNSRQIGGGMNYVQIFGTKKSVASYGPESSTQLTIDGVEHDLAREMTRVLVGDEVLENAEGVEFVNAIWGLYSLDGCWLVEGHIGPDRSTYSVYNPTKEQWECHILGNCLAWCDQPEGLERQGDKSRLYSTGIYALDNVIYTVQGERLTAVELEQGETIMGLECAVNEVAMEVTVVIATGDAESGYRTKQFGYSTASGVIMLRWHPD